MESPSKTQRKKNLPTLRETYDRPGALILTALVVFIGALIAWQLVLPKGERVNPDEYQVVVTTSGKTYFGKLRSTGGEYLVLDHPYTTQAVPSSADNKQPDQSQTALLKLSQQIYGPEDVLSIKSEQVLFWQNLRPDSKVAKAIESKQ